MAYAIVRTDRMSGTKQGADLVSFKYQASNVDAPIENGNVVLITDELVDGDRETFIAKAPAADSPLNKLVLVASSEVLYDERKKNLNEFRNEAGDIARGYHLMGGSNNVFSVTKEALDGKAPAVGNVVEAKAGTKLNVTASATSGSTQVGKIIALENDYIVIKVG